MDNPMTPRFTLHQGNCLDVMKTMADNSVDAVVTDPPYGLSFMGKKWDYDVPSVEIWAECLRVLKPGGHLLAFAGTRTQHRMAVRIEDAGFEIRDMIAWVYGSGFPKSRNICLDMDKMEGHGNRGHRIAVANRHHPDGTFEPNGEQLAPYEPKTDSARQWQGWGTALKPALEPITVARKPLIGTVAENVLTHGTGGINVDGCRVGTEIITQRLATVEGGKSIGAAVVGVKQKATGETTTTIGRWPANLIHDGSDEVVGLFPDNVKGGTWNRTAGARHFNNDGEPTGYQTSGCDASSGSAARFFYCAKANKKDRDEGCDGLEAVNDTALGNGLGRVCAKCGAKQLKPCDCGAPWILPPRRNNHPTVKPTDLMRYICRLVTPPSGVVLDPFMGSGSTGKATALEGFRFIGIELDPGYFEIAKRRIESAAAEPQKT